jgi:hypothetical protein
MKFKLIKLITVCLVTLVVLSPVLAVFSVVWERHMDLLETQDLTWGLSNLNAAHPKHGVTNFSQDPVEKWPDASFIKQLLAFSEKYAIAHLVQWFFLFVPIGIAVIILVYDRYLIYRAAIFRQQVEMLERLWHQSIEQ